MIDMLVQWYENIIWYIGDISFMILLLFIVVYWMVRGDKIRKLGIVLPFFLFFIIVNPFIVQYVVATEHTEFLMRLHRLTWIIPTAIIVSVGITDIINDKSLGAARYILVTISLLLVMFGSDGVLPYINSSAEEKIEEHKALYHEEDYLLHNNENLYHVDKEYLELCDILLKDAGDKKIILWSFGVEANNNNIGNFIRNFYPQIEDVFFREYMVAENMNYSDPKNAELVEKIEKSKEIQSYKFYINDDKEITDIFGNVIEKEPDGMIIQLLEDLGVNYIICQNQRDYLEKCGYKYLAETDNYYILKHDDNWEMPTDRYGWEQNYNGVRYLDQNRNYAIEEWKQIDNDWYYFDAEGYLLTNQWVGNSWVKGNGAMARDEWVDDGQFYVDSEGIFIPDKDKTTAGWRDDGIGKRYQRADATYIADEWKQIDNNWYHFNTDGYIDRNKWIGNSYVKSDGTMARNEWVDNGQFYVDSNGAYVPDKAKAEEGLRNNDIGIYYQKSDGSIITKEWKQIDNNWYYFNEEGYLERNKWIGNAWVKEDGKMAVSEWVDNGQYYVDENGVVVSDMQNNNPVSINAIE